MSAPQPDHSARRLGELMHRLRGLAGPSPEDLVDIDLPRHQLRALLIVTRHGPLSVSALAEATAASLASTSSLVERLVRSGHVRRETDMNDRRVVLLAPTEQGAASVDRLLSRYHARFDRLVEAMSAEGRAALEIGLTDMTRAAERLGLDPERGPRTDQDTHHGDHP